MPHLTLEYTDNLAALDLNHALVASGHRASYAKEILNAEQVH